MFLEQYYWKFIVEIKKKKQQIHEKYRYNGNLIFNKGGTILSKNIALNYWNTFLKIKAIIKVRVGATKNQF